MTDAELREIQESTLVQLAEAILRARSEARRMAHDAQIKHLLGAAQWKLSWGGSPQPTPAELYYAQVDEVARDYVCIVERAGLSGQKADDCLWQEFCEDFANETSHAPPPYALSRQDALRYSRNLEEGRAEARDVYDGSEMDEDQLEHETGFWVMKADVFHRIEELRPGIFDE